MLQQAPSSVASNPKAQAVVAFYYLAQRAWALADPAMQSATRSQRVSVHVSSELPVGAGLGSSAAFCAAAAASLLASLGLVSTRTHGHAAVLKRSS